MALGISVSQKRGDLDQSLLNEDNVSLLIKNFSAHPQEGSMEREAGQGAQIMPFWIAGVTASGYGTPYRMQGMHFGIAHDLSMGCSGKEPKVRKGWDLGY